MELIFEALKQLPLDLVAALLMALEMGLTVLWVPAVFRLGVPVSRSRLQLHGALLSAPMIERAIASAQDHDKSMIFHIRGPHEVFFRGRLSLRRTGTPLLRAVVRIEPVSATVESTVLTCWWGWLLVALVAIAQYQGGATFAQVARICGMVAFILVLFVLFELWSYRAAVRCLEGAIREQVLSDSAERPA